MTIGQRLTHANQVLSAGVEPDEALLGRILAEPRVARQPRRVPRRTLAIAVAILVALGAAAAGVSTLVVRYYGNSDTVRGRVDAAGLGARRLLDPGPGL